MKFKDLFSKIACETDISVSFYWVIPFLIGISVTTVQRPLFNGKIFSIHITPFTQLSVNYRVNKG